MVSTITISTVSTVTTASMVGPIGLIIVLVLLAMLLQKELAVSSSGGTIQRLGRALNVGIIPLAIAFLMIVVVKTVEVFR